MVQLVYNYVLVLLCGVVNHFSLFKFVLTSYIEFYTQWMMKKLHTCTHTKVWFKMSSAGFVGHTDINRTEGVLFFWHIIQTSVSKYWFLWLGIRTRSNYWSYGLNKLQSSKPWFRKIRLGHVRLARQIGPIKWIKQLKYKKNHVYLLLLYIYTKKSKCELLSSLLP